MKRLFVIIVIIAAIILLFPIRGQMKDGGTVVYQAILYTVRDMHAITNVYNEDGSVEYGYTVGITVEILGFEVYDGTEWVGYEIKN